MNYEQVCDALDNLEHDKVRWLKSLGVTITPLKEQFRPGDDACPRKLLKDSDCAYLYAKDKLGYEWGDFIKKRGTAKQLDNVILGCCLALERSLYREQTGELPAKSIKWWMSHAHFRQMANFIGE